MNELQIFNNPEFGEVRIVDIDGEGWFVGRDIATALGYAKPYDAVVRHVDAEDTLKRGIPSRGGEQQTTLINESGMYALIIMSELPSAKKFKRWVTAEVLPAIRKQGGYNLPQLTQAEMMLQMARNTVELERKLEAQGQLLEIQDQRLAVIEQTAQESATKLETTLKVFTNPSIDHWSADMNGAINTMVATYHLSPVKFRGMIYKELEESSGILLGSRLIRRRKDMVRRGATKTEAKTLTKMDVISKDKKLRQIFEGIVKKHQAIYGVQR